MKELTILISLLFNIALCSCQSNNSTEENEHRNYSTESLDTLKKRLHTYVDDGLLAGIQTAILKNDELIHFDSYGYADLENKTPLDSLSIFRIFSMTKPITSIGLMQLFEQGKFKLEDPISQYIPEFKDMTVYSENNEIVNAKNQIKIIDLLRHTSGISYGRSPNTDLNSKYAEANLGNSKDLKTFIKNISQLPLLFEPGTAYEYGYSTDICGYLIEVLSGQPVEDYLQENVLNPLNMNHTHFQLPKEKLNHFTVGYHAAEDGTLQIAERPEDSRFLNKPNFIRAGGGLVSTTNDYLNFCRMLLNKGEFNNKQIIKPETLDLMTQDHLISVRKHTPRLRILPNETGFGLGFSIAERENGSIVYGWGGAVGTYFRIDPKYDLAYIMMIQLSPYRQLNLRETFQELVNDCIIKQVEQQNVIEPILLDKSLLSGKGLKSVELKDQPKRKFFQSQVYKGEEISAYMISSNTADKDFESFPIDEFVFLTKGAVLFEPKDRKKIKFNANDFFVLPRGFQGNIKTVGDPKYHLELSIISNKRADTELISKNILPILLDKELILGEDIQLNENGFYENVFYSGLELEVRIHIERPRQFSIANNKKEQCIHILDGSLNITANKAKTQTFNKGDFFILPIGFGGTIETKGDNLVRMIKISAVK